MDPVTVGSILSLVDWKKVVKGLATDTAGKGARGLFGRLKPDEREKQARQVLELFTGEFLGELEDKVALSAALPGYQEQLKRLIEHAAPDITELLKPETREVDLGPVQRMWAGLDLDPLPDGFDWAW